jgi:hypothetical protein
MPAKRKAADDTAATTAPSASTGAPTESDDAAPSAVNGADEPAVNGAGEPAVDGADGAAEDTEAAPMNRAERRAKGKQQTAAQPAHRGKVVGGKGPAGSQRMWANRRSG